MLKTISEPRARPRSGTTLGTLTPPEDNRVNTFSSSAKVRTSARAASGVTPLARLRSNTGSVYVVDSFVSVLTKTAQGPDPLQSTATYSVTIDSGRGWQITDVGGIGAALEGGR